MVNHNDLADDLLDDGGVDEQAPAGSFTELVRLAVGFACLVALAALLIDTIGTVDDAVAAGASSVQVTEIYAERLFLRHHRRGNTLQRSTIGSRMWP